VWVEGSKVLRSFTLPLAKSRRVAPRQNHDADYISGYKNARLVSIEAKSLSKKLVKVLHRQRPTLKNCKLITPMPAMAKKFTNLYGSGHEGLITAFPTPDELGKKPFRTSE